MSCWAFDSEAPNNNCNKLTPSLVANAVGLAVAEKNLSATYNKPGFPIVSNHVWCMTGDACESPVNMRKLLHEYPMPVFIASNRAGLRADGYQVSKKVSA